MGGNEEAVKRTKVILEGDPSLIDFEAGAEDSLETREARNSETVPGRMDRSRYIDRKGPVCAREQNSFHVLEQRLYMRGEDGIPRTEVIPTLAHSSLVRTDGIAMR